MFELNTLNDCSKKSGLKNTEMIKERNKYELNILRNKRIGWLAVVGCLMVDISVGEFNLLSHLYPYFRSYFRLYDDSITKDDMTYIPMVWLLTQSIVSPLGIALFKYLGYRGSFALFLAIFAGGQFFCSFITNFWLFLPIYAALGGIAQGGCIILPLYCGWRYFPASYKTKISGILLSAYALAPIASSFIALYIVNPHNEPADKSGIFPESVARNVPKFLKFFGVGSFIFGMIGVILIKDPFPTSREEEMELSKNNSKSKESDSSDYENFATKDRKESSKTNEINDSLNAPDMRDEIKSVEKVKMVKTKIQPMQCSDLGIFKDKYFLHVFFIMLIGYLYPHLGLATFKNLGLRGKLDDQWITTAGLAGSIINALSRLVIGLMYEKFGYLCCALFIVFVQITSSLTLEYSAESKWGYLVWLCWFFITYGAQLGLYPLVADTLFHGKGAFSYTILFSAFTLSSVVILNVNDYLGQKLGNNLLYIIAAANLLPIFSMIVIQKRIRAVSKQNANRGNRRANH